MAKILVIETITWKPHIETAMEISLRLTKSGDIVEYHNLRGGLPLCEDSHFIHRVIDLPSIRIKRSAKLLKGISGLTHNVYKFPRQLARAAYSAAKTLSKAANNTDAFVNLEYKQFRDIGWGALSSAISMTLDSGISQPENRQLLTKLLASSILVYDRVSELVDIQKPDKIILFNGRFATTLAAMRAAESHGVPWLIHERGCDRDHYSLASHRPHDRSARQAEIEATWDPCLADLGHEFFEGRRNRVEREWHSFTKHQERGKLPPKMLEGGNWVTFFTSSDDELIAIGSGWENAAFPTQLDAIQAVADVVHEIPNMHLCVRVHPHIARKSSKDKLRWQNLHIQGAIVVGPSEKVDSYALIDHSKIVASYGSTVGVEATYWGKPSMLLGRSFYDELDVSTLISDPDQILQFCLAPTVHNLDGALMYGAYFRSFGEKYQFYKASGLHEGTILGTNLDDSPRMKLARILKGLVGK